MIPLSVAILALSILIALLLGRMISLPIRQLAAAAERIDQWSLSDPFRKKRSLFRELNDANDAFEAAIKGLRSLQVYLPRGLARRLVQSPESEALPSEECIITVLFTDIVSFTAWAEPLPPREVLDLLNRHFTLLASCIRAEQGIVDKFIGDAAMAFWGGLESDRDHALHACRAAARIIRSIRQDNEQRRATGEVPIMLCMGVHSGPAMVGNIGSPGRINFTAIGGTVNMAQRLEAMGRQVRTPDQNALCLISGQTKQRLAGAFSVTRIGRKVLRGRHQRTEVFCLDEESQSTALPGPEADGGRGRD